MRRSFIIATSLALVCATAAYAADPAPMPPRNVVKVETQIGSIATTSDKLTVTLVIEVGANAKAPIVELYSSESFSGGWVKASVATIGELAGAISNAVDAMEAGKTFKVVVDKVEVAAGELSGKPVVVIKEVSDSPFGSRARLYIDGDNATLLSQMLSRAARVAAFLAPRAEKLLAE